MYGMKKCTKRVINSEYEAKKIKEYMQLHQKDLYKYYFHDECNCWHIAHLVSKHKVSQMLNDNYIKPWTKTIKYNKENQK